tara:strand:+ start:472 stop:771 length:300 start_codon:yes stop_codon:yes gene_type:complete
MRPELFPASNENVWHPWTERTGSNTAMKTEQDEDTTVPPPRVPARVHVLGAVLGMSAFMVLLAPLDLLGVDGSVGFVLVLVLGTAAGHVAARYAWRSGK